MRRIIAPDSGVARSRSGETSVLDEAVVTVLFALYDVVSTLACLALAPVAATRVLLGLDTRDSLRERLGGGGFAKPGPVVIHGASVGEILAAEAIVRELESRGGEIAIILSTTSRQGSDVARQIAGRHRSVVECRYLPWDARWIVSRWLRRARPRAVVVVETEIWPGLFRCCEALGIPAAIVSGRIYDRDLGRYRLLRSFFARALSAVSFVGAQSLVEAERFLAIGARAGSVAVLGNLKAAISIESGVRAAKSADRGAVIVAGCTHRGEEAMVLDAVRGLARATPVARLVLAPRDVGRAGEVRRIAAAGAGDVEIVVVDRIGELRDHYAVADVAFVGGSLVDRGGHNPLEALAAGCPVVMGPHLGNVAELVAPFRGTPGLAIVDGAAELDVAFLRGATIRPSERAALQMTVRRRLAGMAGGAETCTAWIESSELAGQPLPGIPRVPASPDGPGRPA